MKKSVVEVIYAFTASQIDQAKSELTIKTYQNILESFARWLEQNDGDMTSLTRLDIQSYIKHLEAEGKSASTINKVFACLSVFARQIKRPDIIENVHIPEARKIQHIAPKSLERNDRNKLMRAIERAGNQRDIAIVYLLVLTGLRVSELVALNRDDVVMAERGGQVTVRSGKGDVSRKVPLSAEARLHLKRYLDTRDDNNTALFISNFKQRISVRAVQHMLAKYGVHPHELRHTFCRELVSKGIDIATVAELAGHSDINVTRRYSKPTEAELQSAIDKAFS